MEKTLREVYLEQFTKNFLNCVELAKRKNADYSGSGTDPFGNFRFSVELGSLPGVGNAVTLEQTLLIRLADKFSRVRELLGREGGKGEVLDESLDDTLADIINYTNILRVWLQLGRPNGDEVYRNEDETVATGNPVTPALKKLAAKFWPDIVK